MRVSQLRQYAADALRHRGIAGECRHGQGAADVQEFTEANNDSEIFDQSSSPHARTGRNAASPFGLWGYLPMCLKD
jgi:hypothetical protein